MRDDDPRIFDRWLFARVNGVALLCVVLLVVNAGTLYWVWRLQQRFHVPIHVGSPNAYVSDSALTGISWLGSNYPYTILPELTPDGRFVIEATFALRYKTAGSEMVLLYRSVDEDTWQRAATRQDNPLEFTATFTADPAATIEYRAAEVVRGEIIRLSDRQQYELAHHSQEYVSIGYIPNFQGSGIDRFYVGANRLVTPFSVEEIVVSLHRKSGTVIKHTWDQEQIASGLSSWVDVMPDVQSVDVIVRYRDGLERTGRAVGPFNQGQILLIGRDE